jgi:hypothetical protein
MIWRIIQLTCFCRLHKYGLDEKCKQVSENAKLVFGFRRKLDQNYPGIWT